MNELLGITYSQFDNIVGTKLLYSFPETIILKVDTQLNTITTLEDIFECLSDYVIMGKHLCGKIIAVRTEDVTFVNYSMAIDNPKYGRNTLLYSFGFALSPMTEIEPYEKILRKISYIFLQLELEREFLFQEATRNTIQGILGSLYSDLVRYGEAFLDLDSSNVIAVKLIKQPHIPLAIHDYEVPMLCVSADNNLQYQLQSLSSARASTNATMASQQQQDSSVLQHANTHNEYTKFLLSQLPWDISIRHLLTCIDGITYVKQLALKPEVSMDVNIVKHCLRVLVHYKCVILTDVLRFSNIYQLTSVGRDFVRRLSQVVVSMSSSSNGNIAVAAAVTASPRNVCQCYSLLLEILQFAGAGTGSIGSVGGYSSSRSSSIPAAMAKDRDRTTLAHNNNQPLSIRVDNSQQTATNATTTSNNMMNQKSPVPSQNDTNTNTAVTPLTPLTTVTTPTPTQTPTSIPATTPGSATTNSTPPPLIPLSNATTPAGVTQPQQQQQQPKQQPSQIRKYVRCIQQFLCALQPGRSLARVILHLGKQQAAGKQFQWHGIQLRRLVAILAHRGLIRRVHEYPVNLCTSMGTGSSSNVVVGDDVLNGALCLDAICAAHSVDPNAVVGIDGVRIVFK